MEPPPVTADPRPRPAPILDFGVGPLELPLRPVSQPDAASAAPQVGGTGSLSSDTGPGIAGNIFLEDVVTEDIFLKDPPAGEIGPAPRAPGFLWRWSAWVGRGLAWCVRSLFGITSLVLLLAVIAAIPIVNFLALGYLLEVEGRVARSGRLRDAFPLLDQAPRLGAIALGFWVWLIPVRLLSDVAAEAHLIDPGAFADVGLHLLLVAVAIGVGVHLCLALAQGGDFWAFFWPLLIPLGIGVGGVLLLVTARYVFAALLVVGLVVLAVHRRGTGAWLAGGIRAGRDALWGRIKSGLVALRRLPTIEYWNQASLAIGEFIASLRLKHHFLLGLKGFCGALLWLVIPTAVFAAAKRTEGGPVLLTLAGGLLLMLVLSWVAFLQAHFAAENRWGAMFELRTVRRLFLQAPLSWLVTILVTLALALPMYLFKVKLPPGDAMWLETIVFIVTIYPVKVLTGWTYHRAVSRPRRAFWGFRWISRLALVPLLAAYVFLLFFTQFIGEHGKLVLFQHHAFLLPAPF